MLLFSALLDPLEVLVEVDEGIVLVVLAGDVSAGFAEAVELLLELLCGSLDVGFDALEVLLVVHLCAGVTDDADILGEEFVAVLIISRSVGKHRRDGPYEAEESRELEC